MGPTRASPLDFPPEPSDLGPMTPPAPADDRKESLRPLLARIWRDYLSNH